MKPSAYICLLANILCLFTIAASHFRHQLSRVPDFESRPTGTSWKAQWNWPVLLIKEVEEWKAYARRLQLWEVECTTGLKDLHTVKNDRIGNARVYNSVLLRPLRFLTALRIGNNAADCRVAMNTTTPLTDTLSRKWQVPEALEHILITCMHAKEHLIRLHDYMIDLFITDIPREGQLCSSTEVAKRRKRLDSSKTDRDVKH